MSVKKLAEKVASTSAGAGNAINPGFITLLIELIPIVLKCLEERGDNTANKVRDRAKNPGPFGKIALRMRLRREMGRKDFREAGGRKLVEDMIDVARDNDNTPILKAAMEEVDES